MSWSCPAWLAVLLPTLLLAVTALALAGLRFWAWRRRQRAPNQIPVVGIFHPYCEAGGGGERVLWLAVQALQQAFPPDRLRIQVYTAASTTDDAALMERARSTFNLPEFRYPVRFVRLRGTRLLEAARWPRFTLLGQSLGSMAVAWEALWAESAPLPHFWLDTMGYAFTYPVARLVFGCRVLAYVHYPTISTDMLRAVRERRPVHNNRVAPSLVASRLKLVYYWVFAGLYSLCGRLACLAMVNSSWTRGHIQQLWGWNWGSAQAQTQTQEQAQTQSQTGQQGPAGQGLYSSPASGSVLGGPRIELLFPPCDTRDLQQLPLEPRERLILSVAQFRPEKDHALQLRSFARFRREQPERSRGVQLCLVGGARDQGDLERVRELRELARELDLRVVEEEGKQEQGVSSVASAENSPNRPPADQDDGNSCADANDKDVNAGVGVGGNPEACVRFVVNARFAELRALLGRARVGLHTMWNEHFGISVVEFMAAGAIPLAHDSGGPRADIVGEGCGYRAASEEAYAAAMAEIFAPGYLGSPGMRRMQERARERAQGFSQELFVERFQQLVVPLIEEGRG